MPPIPTFGFGVPVRLFSDIGINELLFNMSKIDATVSVAFGRVTSHNREVENLVLTVLSDRLARIQKI